ncbi:MAG: YlbF family regulator [Halobacteriales archaeon]|nr:YlbF family regulator [Halobacteriales archaeon]
MSVDTEAAADERSSVEAMGRELGDAIAELPEYEAFEAARQAVQADDEAQEKIKEFEQVRQQFAMARQTGQADEEDLEGVQQAQEELHALPVMEEFIEAQEALVDQLEAVNEAISEPLAVDFGGEAGGCCND